MRPHTALNRPLRGSDPNTVRGYGCGVLRDPRNMVKAELPEARLPAPLLHCASGPGPDAQGRAVTVAGSVTVAVTRRQRWALPQPRMADRAPAKTATTPRIAMTKPMMPNARAAPDCG
ncbi:hypothetical protein GCM10027610_071640 [Dactylosporangium cerinum]